MRSIVRQSLVLSGLVGALAPAAADAQRARSEIEQGVARHAPATIAIRHRLHQNPELSNREEKTAALVAEHLRALGLEVRTGIARHGVIATLRGGRPGPVIAVRADMDALPVTEETNLPFKSTVRTTYLGKEVGVAHACGHDVHTSVQLGVATVLAGMKARIPGTIQFIFQPAEEGAPRDERPAGAEQMLAEGIWKRGKPVAVFGLHSSPELTVGEIGYTPGPAYANTDEFTALIKGRQSHGARPQDGVDPVVMAAQAVLALQTIRSRNIAPIEPAVVTVGIIRGGERNNIIPGEVELTGTVRTYSAETRAYVEKRMREILGGVTAAGGGAYRLDWLGGYPFVRNDTTLTRRSAAVIEKVTGPGKTKVLPPSLGGEDFSYFANATPGFFYYLGTTKPGGTSGGWHTPTFTADDASVTMGMRVMAEVLLSFLDGGGKTLGMK